MIKSFKNKELGILFLHGGPAKISSLLQKRLLKRLDALNKAKTFKGLNLPGFNFHGLQGKPKRYSIHINGPWCITFEWNEPDAYLVDLEQYH